MACDCRGTSLTIPDDLTPKNGCVVVNTVTEATPGCQHELNENGFINGAAKKQSQCYLDGHFNVFGRNI